jgi:hypothetical protein
MRVINAAMSQPLRLQIPSLAILERANMPRKQKYEYIRTPTRCVSKIQVRAPAKIRVHAWYAAERNAKIGAGELNLQVYCMLTKNRCKHWMQLACLRTSAARMQRKKRKKSSPCYKNTPCKKTQRKKVSSPLSMQQKEASVGSNPHR